MDIQALAAAQRAFFRSGATLDLSFRRQALDRLEAAIRAREGEIQDALGADLNKPPLEGYMCETGLTLAELNYVRRHFARWARPRCVPTPLAQFPAKSRIIPQPLGAVLIISPWNYPFLLTLEPLIGAVAAGCCCLVKPSASAPASARVLRALIADAFSPGHVAALSGDREANRTLLDLPFDHIFFTGGAETGRQVMEHAARNLTPVTLELGGKSPCVVDATARLDLAAKRLVFGKLLNCGQTCVAPDYLLVDRRIQAEFLARVEQWITRLYGRNPLDNQGYVRMINRRQFERVRALIDPDKAAFGGRWDEDALKIQPTILTGVSPEDPVMQEEIFGPVLPVLPFDHIQQAMDFIADRPHPLALYLFSQDRAVQRRFLRELSFGGGCVNDTILHLASSRLPFGGMGRSGMGSYHGRRSFDTFTHEKGVLVRTFPLDPPLRYPPYTPWKERLVRRFLK